MINSAAGLRNGHNGKKSIFDIPTKILFKMKVSDILGKKGNAVYAATSDLTVYDALRIMGEKNIGALPVIDNGQLKGIISERDYARKVVLQNRSSKEMKVSEIMTANVITVTADHTLEQCMQLMSDKHIRHLPVMANDQVSGILSISDIVTAVIESQKQTIEHLKNYISST